MNNFRRVLLGVISCTLLVNCNNNTVPTQEKVLNVDKIDTLSDVLLVADSLCFENDTIEDGDSSIWQITDYAEYLIGSEIAETSDDLRADGNGWFYAELDVQAGYANISGNIDGWSEFVIWRMQDGRDLVASLEAGCGPVCEYLFTFHIGNGKDLTEPLLQDIMPLTDIEAHRTKLLAEVLKEYELEYPEDHQLFFNFPKEGTAMIVDLIVGADEIQIPLLKLSWNKSTFEIEEFYDEI